MGSLNCSQADRHASQADRHPSRQTPKQTDRQTAQQADRWEIGSVGKKTGQPWQPKGFTRWFLSLRKTLTKTGLDSGCKQIGFPSAPQPGFYTFSSSTLVEGGWPHGRPSTFEAALLSGASPLLSSASLAFSGLRLSCSTSCQARV